MGNGSRKTRFQSESYFLNECNIRNVKTPATTFADNNARPAITLTRAASALTDETAAARTSTITRTASNVRNAKQAVTTTHPLFFLKKSNELLTACEADKSFFHNNGKRKYNPRNN